MLNISLDTTLMIAPLGLVTAGMIALSVGLSLLAGYLLAKKNKATLKDDKPTTLVTRGAYINWICGIRRVGPLMCGAWNRRFSEESTGKKGLGGSSPKTKVWWESGWHLLAVGPCFALHRIMAHGQVIFQGPITRDSHPSGSYVDVGSEGGFFIYWGEPTQPVNTYLGDAGRVGVSSRWPYHCYVVWADKRLGPSPNWALLDYELERRPENSNLVDTEAYMPPRQTLTGPSEPIFDLDLNGVGSDFFILQGAHSTSFISGGKCRMSGNALPDQDLDIFFSKQFQAVIGTTIFGTDITETRTQVHFTHGTLSGADTAGTLQAYDQELDAGINAAHAIDDMLHTTWPVGMGLPTSGSFAAFDLASLEDLGTLLSEADEDLRTSWVSLGGDTFQTVLGTGLQDLGVMIPMDPDTGLIKFVPVREPVGTLARIRNELIVGKMPETETSHGARPADRLTFSFASRDLLDRDGTIARMDDGQISYTELQNARNIQLTSTTVFETAAKMTNRRSQEELAGASVTNLDTNRATRTLVPGTAVTVDALPEIMRVSGVKLSTDSNIVKLELMADHYGVAKSPFIDNPPPVQGGLLPVEADIQKALIEVPEHLLGSDELSVIIPRIRAHAQVFQAGIYLSGDGATYHLQGTEFDLQAGGTINAALPAPNTGGTGAAQGGLMLHEVGPEFTALGPDIGTVQDLSSDDLNWLLGRQAAVIVSSAGVELCFLRNVTAIGGGVWRADGLVRGRFDTVPLSHPAGAEIYIFEQADIAVQQDVLLVAGSDIYAKTQPKAGGILPLDADSAVSKTLHGKGITAPPVPAGALAVISPNLINVYQTGDDVGVRWDWGTPQTLQGGAGTFPAGQQVLSYPAPDGDFQLEIRDVTGVTVHRTENPATNAYTYLNTNLVAEVGAGEPSFQIWVYQRRNGLLSDPVKLLVERI